MPIDAGTGTVRQGTGAGSFKVLFINNNGGGYAREYTVSAGTTVDQFIAQQLRDDPKALMIRVNNSPVLENQQLHSGDTVTATPVNIKGARA